MPKSDLRAKLKRIIRNGGGFTFMEVIIAMGLIVSSLVFSLALISFSISSTRTSRFKIIAISLSQEGLEIVRNIRDNTWLEFKRKPSEWREDLPQGNSRVEYDKLALLPYTTSALMVDTAGFYFYDDQGSRAGSITSPFQRTINIQYIDDNQVKVTSEVKWQEKGVDKIIKAETRLYNWLEEPET